jgi:hypothetical protein
MAGNIVRVAALLFLCSSICTAQSGSGSKPPSSGPGSKPAKSSPATASQSSSPTQKSNSNTETFKVTSPIRILHEELGNDLTTEPYKSGEINYKSSMSVGGVKGVDAESLLNDLNIAHGQDVTDKRITIIHVLRWKDDNHTTVSFQKWYVYDPAPPKSDFYVISKQKIFEGTNIAGRKNFRFVYLHFNANFEVDAGTTDESIKSDCLPPTTTPMIDCLKYPVSYTIAVSKKQTQFIQDLKTVLGLVLPGAGGGGPDKAVPKVTGYWSMSEFSSQYETSTITITPSMNSSAKPTQGTQPGQTGQDTAAAQLSPNTYTNEKPSYIGLSFAIPVTSYKDITFQSSSGTLVPKSITQQNVYVNFDFYYPAAQPGLAALRWIPHPFVGLPIKGKVLQHTMAGVAFGLPWCEPFAGLVFDVQNASVDNVKQKTTLKGVFGFKVSVSLVAKALMKK